MEAMTNGRIATGSGPMTVSDLEGMPDDGRRYELIDGMLIVSPAPGTRHQQMVGQLFAALDSARPPGHAVMVAPFAVHHGDSIELQPDVLVAPVNDFTERDLPEPPLLAVEVLSPSTAIYDLNTKKAVYERLGVPNYWVIDPIALHLTVFKLEDGRYAETASVARRETFSATEPFEVDISPADLLGPFA